MKRELLSASFLKALALNVKVRFGVHWQESFLKIVYDRIVFSVKIMVRSIPVTRVTNHRLWNLTSLFNFTHNLASFKGLMFKFTAIFLVYNMGFLGYFVPQPKQALATVTVECKDGYAIQLKEGEPYAGFYIRCEDYDTFWTMVENGQTEDAKRFIFGPVRFEIPRIRR